MAYKFQGKVDKTNNMSYYPICHVPANYQTQRSPTSEGESHSVDKAIPHHLWDQTVLCQVHKKPLVYSIVNQIKSHYTYFQYGLLSLTSSSQLSCSFTAITPRHATCPAHVIHLEYLFVCFPRRIPIDQTFTLTE